MTRGRRPLPMEVKLQRDTVRKRPLPANGKGQDGPVVVPTFLEGRAAALWAEYTPALVETGWLCPVDRHAFAFWCQLAELAEARLLPASYCSTYRGLADSFGMSRAARARAGVQSDDAAAEEDPAELYFRDAPSVADDDVPVRRPKQ